MGFKCSFERWRVGTREIPHRDCGGSAQSAAELFAGYVYDEENPEPPVPKQTVVVEALGVRRVFTVTSRVSFDAVEVEQGADEQEGGEND